MKNRFDHMCCGPSDERIRYHEDCIDYHKMMIEFYKLSAPRQLAFMALFQCLLEEQQEKKSS